MSRTLGRRAARNRTNGDYRTTCDECGADELRSKLIRLPTGLLVHPSEAPRRDALTLDRANANASTVRRTPYRRDGGNT